VAKKNKQQHGRPCASASVEDGLVGAGTMLAAHIADSTVTTARALERPMLQRGEKRGEREGRDD